MDAFSAIAEDIAEDVQQSGDVIFHFTSSHDGI